MLKRSAYKNRKEHGLKPSIHENNAKYSKPKTKNGWVAGGHAPQGKPPPWLSKRIKEWLKRNEQNK